MAKPHAHYSANSYNEYLSLKPSLGLYLMLIALLKSWGLFIAALAIRGDSNQLMTLLYPDKWQFLYDALSSLPALFLLLSLIRRQPNAHPLIVWLWQHGNVLLWATIGLQSALLGLRLYQSGYGQNGGLVLDAVLLLWSGLYLIRSDYLTDLFASFPEN